MSRRLCIGGGVASGAVFASPAVHGHGTRVGLKLAFATDVSGSVDQERFELQRDGTIQALQSEHVLDMIDHSPEPAAFMAYYWAVVQVMSVPWTLIRNRGDVARFCAAFASCARPGPNDVGVYTHISTAIDYGVRQLRGDASFIADRMVIDISGDGSNSYNAPGAVEDARDAAVAGGVVINGLPIKAPGMFTPQPPQGITAYYEESVIGGDGSFAITADGYEDIRRALSRKVVREFA